MSIFDRNIFDANIFDAGAAVAVGAGGERWVATTFTRKRWRELIAARDDLQKQAENRDIDRRKRKRIEQIADAARKAIKAIEDDAATATVEARVASLERLVSGARSASLAINVVAEAKRVAELVQQAILDEQEEEELMQVLALVA